MIVKLKCNIVILIHRISFNKMNRNVESIKQSIRCPGMMTFYASQSFIAFSVHVPVILHLTTEGLIHSILLRSRFRFITSLVLFLLDVGFRSRSNSVTYQRPRTKFSPHYCFHY